MSIGSEPGLQSEKKFENKEKVSLRVLVAEDDPIIAKVTMMFLKGLGHKAEHVENGQLLLDRLASGEKYDLVITDNGMPKVTGLEALKIIRDKESTKNLPVIVYTGEDHEFIQRLTRSYQGIFVLKGSSDSFGKLQSNIQNIAESK